MILVTGPTGFVGRHVVKALTSGGHPVRALVHTASRESVLTRYDVEMVHGDILDPDSLSRACEGVEAVIHLVALLRETGDLTFQRVNYLGTRNILEAAAAANVKRIIHASTIGASSDPAVPYMYSRWMAEQETNRSLIPHTVVRLSFGFGEGDEFFNTIAAQVKLSPIVPVVGSGKARFQPIAIEDIARCLVAAYERDDTIGRTIEVGGPEYLTYEAILDLVAESLHVKIAKVHVPMSLLKTAMALMEAFMPRPPATGDQIKMLETDNITDLDSVERAFGFAPRSPRGNLGYLSKIGLSDALKIHLGSMPAHIRDH